MKKIVVKIHKGEVTVTPEGYKGETCKDATKLIEKALGKVVSDQATTEAFETPPQEYINENGG